MGDAACMSTSSTSSSTIISSVDNNDTSLILASVNASSSLSFMKGWFYVALLS